MSGGKCKTHSEDPSLHQAVKANRSTLSDPHFRNYLPSLEKIKEKGKRKNLVCSLFLSFPRNDPKHALSVALIHTRGQTTGLQSLRPTLAPAPTPPGPSAVKCHSAMTPKWHSRGSRRQSDGADGCARPRGDPHGRPQAPSQSRKCSSATSSPSSFPCESRRCRKSN